MLKRANYMITQGQTRVCGDSKCGKASPVRPVPVTPRPKQRSPWSRDPSSHGRGRGQAGWARRPGGRDWGNDKSPVSQALLSQRGQDMQEGEVNILGVTSGDFEGAGYVC